MSLPFDLSEILGVFIAEAEEHIENLNEGVLVLEKDPKDLQIIEKLFREAHSLKGASGTVGFTEIRDMSHQIEDILADIRDRRITFDASVADKMFSGLDKIKDLMAEIAKGGGVNENFPMLSETKEEDKASPEPKENDVSNIQKEVSPETKPTVKPAKKKNKEEPKEDGERASAPTVEEFVRVPLSRIDSILNLGGALVINKIKSVEKLRSFKKVGMMAQQMEKRLGLLNDQLQNQNTLTIPPDLIEALQECTSEIGKIKEEVERVSEDVLGEALHIEPIMDQLQRHIREIRMLPCSTIFSSFPRLVRDVAQKQGKQVTLKIEGEETELDKKVLEGIKEPLIHILRNAIDHGLETPEERRAQNKSETCTIRLSAFHKGENVVIEIQDDGRGFDKERIKSVVLQKQMATSEDLEKMSDKEIFNFVFMSGFSTSQFITDISGRGVGMDVVRTQIEHLKGQVEISSEKGVGTTLLLELPLTIAIIQALMLKAGGRTFGIPLSAVDEIARIPLREIYRVENKMAFELRNRVVPIVPLDETVGIPSSQESKKSGNAEVTIVIITSLYGRVGFSVDQLLGKEEIYLKNLGAHLGKLRNISGATMLRTGEIVLILDPVDLVVSSKQSKGSVPMNGGGQSIEKMAAKRRLLVVEDSMTTRELIRPILEGEGYEVDTAIDGIDGIEKVSLYKYDLIISDIEMPRMNGLELCHFLKDNESYRDIPLIFVTARGSEEEKRRGIEVGAQAYIAKGSFDQSNLIETIGRLIA